ncbi:MAG TPA: hypothetical protein DDY93_05130 [Dehalococcoidia bacterium]|nr:twin-arginine translocation signal domain-containing protein [SAR202 cluster bacterium]HAC19064.1 hypothetical protein [Dehalococcoidia bacterium]HBD82564.1 hypothetical protein [Dehalococcoidia bacterium]HBJ30733.1 hypothetical protein [Dehalococcoidia bacterium]HIM15944.1 twin-arginine translocation signal domain-containing protein [Dehalococcoidia bacterium]
MLAPLVIWHANHLTRLFSMKVLAERRNFLKLSGITVAGFGAC